MSKKKTTNANAAQPAAIPTTVATKAAKAKTPKKAKAKKEAKPKKVSALDAAANVLADAGKAMTCAELIATMAEKGLWTSPGGKTPANTLYAAIMREINTKAKEARFKKTEPGKFAATA
jgi:hypothetical protein